MTTPRPQERRPPAGCNLPPDVTRCCNGRAGGAAPRGVVGYGVGGLSRQLVTPRARVAPRPPPPPNGLVIASVMRSYRRRGRRGNGASSHRMSRLSPMPTAADLMRHADPETEHPLRGGGMAA